MVFRRFPRSPATNAELVPKFQAGLHASNSALPKLISKCPPCVALPMLTSEHHRNAALLIRVPP
jgi:hypothetical protein